MAFIKNSVEVVWACDIDKYAEQVYFENYRLEPHGDITKIHAEDIPELEILCTGFPCQPFSNAGKRKGLEDARGTLFYDIARILEFHKTPYFVLENVPNLISHDKGRTIQVIQEVFQGLGY